MKRLLLTVFLCSCQLCIHAVDNLRWADIQSLGMGINGVTQSFTCNPALTAYLPYKNITVDYFNRYGLKELGSLSAGFVFPNKILSAGINCSSFGYDDYRESLFRLSAGKQLGRNWYAGVSAQLALLQTDLYEAVPKQLGIDLGLLYQPVDKLLIGLLIMNCPTIHINKENTENKDIIDYYFQIGFQYQLINSLLIVASAGSSADDKFVGHIGVEYEPFRNFSIRAGLCSAPLLPTFGIGYSFSHFGIHLAAVHHPVLGISSGVGIQYQF